MEARMENRRCIVVVEDCYDEREALRLMLEIEGYYVVALAGAQEALDYMRSTAPLPSVILLDLMMNGTNGWEFRTEQLRDSRMALVPVVVCSGDGRLSEKATALGITEHLEKPIDCGALLELVARHCAN
jgi:CheY-like chemotaxis protein